MSIRERFSVVAIAAIAAVLLLVDGPTPARAALIVQVMNSTPIGGRGSFDVVLSDTAGTADVTGFSVELSVPSDSGILFAGVDTSTSVSPYLFGTLQSPPFSFTSFPTTDFTASDASLTPPFFVTLVPNSAFGLAHVTYTVAAGAGPGPVVVSIVSSGTLLTDRAANPIPYTPANGTIIATTVPEPSSLLLLSTGIVAVCSISAIRRSHG